MAKKTAKPTAPTSIDVRYDLRNLPSAQHKAGLAGLLLQIESMRERRDKGLLEADRDVPEVVEQTATTAVIRFSERSAQDLFDDLYNANPIERWTYKWPKDKKGRPKREVPEEVTDARGRKSVKVRLFYDDAEPFSFFLDNFTQGDKESWHKLWREMIYDVPRNKPMTRQAFKSRAEGQPTKEGGEAWKSLLALVKAQAKGTPAKTELAGSLMLAVQAVTAEAIPFEDRVEAQLLLHFWPLTARVFVPQRVNSDGESKFVGYALAIPEVGDLCRFCDRYKELLQKLDAKKNLFRPAGAVVVLPEQGPLEFLHNLDRLTAEKSLAGRTAKYVAGIEFFYMVVDGKNVKLKAHGRIPVQDKLIAEYGMIRRDFHNSEMVAGLILALLRNRPWFAELDAPLHEREWSYFVHSAQDRRRTPPAMFGFAWDADHQFKGLISTSSRGRTAEEPAMSQPDASPEAVDAIIYELVRIFVRERACARAGLDPDKDKDWWTRTADERRVVCAKLFLEFRSRHGDEFVAYFADTIASVAQWLDEDRFLIVSRALMLPHTPHDGPGRPRTRDDVKTLTMLALAAHSRSLKTKDAAVSTTPTSANATENAG